MQVNTWDDHDIFDGWGSYPHEVQTCPLFQMIHTQAHRFYLLGQHATTPALAASDGYVVNPGNTTGQPLPAVNYVGQLGPSVFVVVPDSRSQRSRERIIKAESMDRMKIAVRIWPPHSGCTQRVPSGHAVRRSKSPSLLAHDRIHAQLLRSDPSVLCMWTAIKAKPSRS